MLGAKERIYSPKENPSEGDERNQVPDGTWRRGVFTLFQLLCLLVFCDFPTVLAKLFEF